ncbi:hypothetical protein N0V83_003278 [Neocucurbitaria cava]|uniref:Uncharacterized protein n=1 Tax=Neocucurbitaria cava TaxID=798079 RepID=A0A9W8YBF1_9PLEO|nr:hypothetical protein N0V83_003278 [Neocucurbitaria cava]
MPVLAQGKTMGNGTSSQRVTHAAFVKREDGEVRQFAYCYDAQLLAYLAERSISPTFLHEIDSFFLDHPELASYEKGRKFLSDMRMLSPLSAYITFIIGYTMPARYIYDINTKLPLLLQLPPGFSHTPLSEKYEYDPELMDIFEDWGPSWGHAARLRILDQIDETVSMGIRKLALGRPVNYDLRKLICYAIWGNPVDAYKWFRYSYQLDNLKDHYLPEHIILVQAPNFRGYAEPQPLVPGIDVLDVLVKDYRIALVRSGHSRVEIEKRCATAKAKLAQAPTGIDIVDLIMDDAVGRRGTNRRGARKPRNTTRTKRR